uniref:Uncharacterized protein n=1 Tax=Romanomermis culicivorax TaxID=13658 RepID=A0A915HF86_ROMCU
MQGLRREKFNRRIDTRRIERRCQRDTVPRVHGSKICVVWQSRGLAWQMWFESCGTGQRGSLQYWSCSDDQ